MSSPPPIRRRWTREQREPGEDNTRFDFARNALVVVIRATLCSGSTPFASWPAETFATSPSVTPTVSRSVAYSKAALLAAGIWDALQGRIVNTQNVRQSLDYVARGEVDAAFGYRTDAAILPDKVRIMMEVPTIALILYPIAVVKSSNTKSVAGNSSFTSGRVPPGKLLSSTALVNRDRKRAL